MSRWWLAVLLGWLLLAISLAYDVESTRTEQGAALARCACATNAKVVEVPPDDAPPHEALGNGLRLFGEANAPGAAPALPAPSVRHLWLRRPARGHPSGVNVELDASAPAGARRLALLFDAALDRGADATAHQREVAVAPVAELLTLGRPLCAILLDLERGDRVRVTVAALDDAGALGASTTVAAELIREEPWDDPCYAMTCGTGGEMLLLLAGSLWALVSFAVALGAGIAWLRRHTAAQAAPAEPLALAAISRVGAHVQREQLGYAVFCALFGVAIAVRYPELALVGLLPTPFIAAALLRWRAASKLLALAARPGALIEQKGPLVLVACDNDVASLFVAPKRLAAAAGTDVPTMRSRA